ncbi:MAG: hypothetical protein JXR70_16750 [Spirochaetales bacterium]|nr:hypothetical protein [Spirochaetales bacterium]
MEKLFSHKEGFFGRFPGTSGVQGRAVPQLRLTAPNKSPAENAGLLLALFF